MLEFVQIIFKSVNLLREVDLRFWSNIFRHRVSKDTSRGRSSGHPRWVLGQMNNDIVEINHKRIDCPILWDHSGGSHRERSSDRYGRIAASVRNSEETLVVILQIDLLQLLQAGQRNVVVSISEESSQCR